MFRIIPPVVPAVVAAAAVQPPPRTIVPAISLVSWPPLVRLVRTQFLQLMPAGFI